MTSDDPAALVAAIRAEIEDEGRTGGYYLHSRVESLLARAADMIDAMLDRDMEFVAMRARADRASMEIDDLRREIMSWKIPHGAEKARADRAEARVDELTELAKEMIAYVPDYFRDKWGFDDILG